MRGASSSCASSLILPASLSPAVSGASGRPRWERRPARTCRRSSRRGLDRGRTRLVVERTAVPLPDGGGVGQLGRRQLPTPLPARASAQVLRLPIGLLQEVVAGRLHLPARGRVLLARCSLVQGPRRWRGGLPRTSSRPNRVGVAAACPLALRTGLAAAAAACASSVSRRSRSFSSCRSVSCWRIGWSGGRSRSPIACPPPRRRDDYPARHYRKCSARRGAGPARVAASGGVAGFPSFRRVIGTTLIRSTPTGARSEVAGEAVDAGPWSAPAAGGLLPPAASPGRADPVARARRNVATRLSASYRSCPVTPLCFAACLRGRPVVHQLGELFDAEEGVAVGDLDAVLPQLGVDARPAPAPPGEFGVELAAAGDGRAGPSESRGPSTIPNAAAVRVSGLPTFSDSIARLPSPSSAA